MINKNFISTLAMTLFATASFAQQSVEYRINGTCPASVKTVYVMDIDGRRPEVIDSAKVEAGKFAINGKSDKDALLGLTTTKRGYRVFFNDGKPITADLTNNVLKGSELNTKLNAFDREVDALSVGLEPLYQQVAKIYSVEGLSKQERQNKLKELQPKIEAIDTKLNARKLEIIKANMDNLIPVAYLGDVIFGLEYNEMKDLLDDSRVYAKHPALNEVKRYYAIMAKKASFIGKKFVDIVENDVKDKAVNTLIKRGTPVQLQIEKKKAKGCGKAGYVNIKCISTTSVDGQNISLEGSMDSEGDNKKGLAIGLGVGLGLTFLPFVGFGFLAIKGEQAKIQANTIMPNVFIMNDYEISK